MFGRRLEEQESHDWCPWPIAKASCSPISRHHMHHQLSQYRITANPPRRRDAETRARRQIMHSLQLPHLDDDHCAHRLKSWTLSELHRIDIVDFEDGARFSCLADPAAILFPYLLGRVQ